MFFRLFPNLSPVWWMWLGGLGRSLANARHPLSPPVLIISLPRSGSSWVGDTLGASPGALYLREPINQAYTARRSDLPTVHEMTEEIANSAYQAIAADALGGMPAFPRGVVRRPDQWRLSSRTRRRPVVKEVNPLATAWLAENFRPRIIFLRRHPAAVAHSVHRQGWTGLQFQRKFQPETVKKWNLDRPEFARSFWTRHGAFQALVMIKTMEALEAYGEFLPVCYETVCESPVEQFRAMYEYAELPWSDEVEQMVLSRSSSSSHDRSDTYGTARDSRKMIESWRRDMDDASLAEVRDAYLALDSPFYGPDDW